MTTTGNGHSRAATSARRRGRRGDVRPGQEPIAALTPDLGPLPPIPVMHGAVLATDPTLVIARLIARAWMRYRTDGHRTRRARRWQTCSAQALSGIGVEGAVR
jgi:hypothetical protein